MTARRPTASDLDQDFKDLTTGVYIYPSDAAGWYKELTRICILSVDLGLGWWKLDNPDFIVFSPVGRPGEKTQSELIHVGRPVISFVADRYLVVPEFESTPHLLVDLDAPDGIIREQLEMWMKEIRNYYNSVSKPGRYALNSKFDQVGAFKRWRESKILQLADVLSWRASLPKKYQRTFTNSRISEEMWPDSEEPKKRLESAKKNLDLALSCLSPLFAQVHWEQVGRHAARQAIAQWVAERLGQQSTPHIAADM